MPKRGRNLLSAKTVLALKKPGRHSDGGGLFLVIRDRDGSLSRSWAYIYKRGRRGEAKERFVGLGAVLDVTLAQAREKAALCRDAVSAGGDPWEAVKPATQVPTFGKVADDMVADLTKGFRNPKHRAQWESTLSDAYCASLRKRPIDKISTEDVLTVLKPIWRDTPETASRLRGRIEKVLDSAKARDLRSGDNPARWRGHLQNLLSKPPKLSRGHHKALAWRDMPPFMERLRALDTISAKALEWTILTAARTNETVMCKRSEIVDGVWTIPASRMKAKREHRVPLCGRCLEIMAITEPLGSEWLFPSPSGKRKHLSLAAMAECLKDMNVDATVHGFRSTFRDWCGDATTFPKEIAEAALAHVIGDKTEAAYRRSDALERRRHLMTSWEMYLGNSGNVVRLKRVE